MTWYHFVDAMKLMSEKKNYSLKKLLISQEIQFRSDAIKKMVDFIIKYFSILNHLKKQQINPKF